MEALAGNREANSSASMTRVLLRMWQNTRGILSDSIELIALESRRAGLSIALMIGLGLGAALLLITAWFLLIAAAALGLINLGMSWALALLALAAINILACVPLVILIKRFSKNLTFAASRRQILSALPRKDDGYRSGEVQQH